MPRPLRAQLLPDAELHELLGATLQRVNKASNAALVAAVDHGAKQPAEIRAFVKDEVERVGLPATFVTPAVDRVARLAATVTGRKQRFSGFQSLVLPASAVKWPGTDRVVLPTAAGKRTVRVRVDPTRGGLRPPLEGRAVALVFRNGEFELVAVEEPGSA
ncbi:MAG: hypothetical protein U0V73_16130 [Acidimicrobiia bacterium]